jgi:ribosomal protein S12 methylthiotransferase accessory factor
MILDNSLTSIIGTLDYLLDYDVGIIKYIKEIEINAGDPSFFHFFSKASNTRAFCKQKNYAFNGGASFDRDIALAKAVGEAVERYCIAIYDPYELPLCSFNDAPFPCVHPEDFVLYNEHQYNEPRFPFVPFKRNTKTKWVPAYDPLDKETISVPAPMVYVPYDYSPEIGESQITQSISTGLACHIGIYKAAINAVCEVIERDAVMITWQAMISPPKIKLDTISHQNFDIVERFKKSGYSISLFNITLDIDIPTILSVATNDSPEVPPIVLAASTAPNPEDALRKSLEELEHTRYYCHSILYRLPRLDPLINYDLIFDQDSHLNFWCDRRNFQFSDFLFKSEQYIDFSEIKNIASGNAKDDLYEIIKKIKNAGYRTLLCDVTTSDIEYLGLKVVRAIIPGFHPLFVGHAFRSLGGSRLWNIPQKMGYKGIHYGHDNPVPHPYP